MHIRGNAADHDKLNLPIHQPAQQIQGRYHRIR